MKVCLGGTFHPFHIGHEAMLRAATRDATAVFIGITDGALAERADRDVPPWQERAKAVEAFLRTLPFGGEQTLRPLDDAWGPAATGEYDAIVVSPETRRGAEAINAERTAAGLRPLHVRVVPHVLGDDLLPVSATRVHAGDIDRSGRRLSPLRVAAGSDNPVKLAGIEAGLARVFAELELDVRGAATRSGVPEQPREGDTLAGAQTRAREAAARWPEADYAIGVEAGLNQDPAQQAWYDAQACVVQDPAGAQTDGWGPAFQYPQWVTQRALSGEMVSDILGPVADDPQIGGTTGAIGFLTDGRMDRTELTAIAVLMAFVPRIRAGLYASSGGDVPASPP